MTNAHPPSPRSYRPYRYAIPVFLLAGALSAGLIGLSERHRVEEWRAEVALIAANHAHGIQSNVERALSATYALAALVRRGGGSLPDFTATANQLLPFYQGASALALAPEGVVREIVPLSGNERAIGHDLLKDPQRDKEAIKARDTGQLTLAGPFKLVQGGFAAAGRLPVYLGDRKLGAPFWGFVSVLIRFPETLQPAHLAQLVDRGYDYVLWRIHPDNGERQIIAASSTVRLEAPVDRGIGVPNGHWTLSVAPRGGWDRPGLLAAKILAALFSCTLLAALAELLGRLRWQQAELESRVAERTQELAKNEARYRSLFADSTVTMLLIDPEDGRIVSANQAAADYYGYPLDALQAMNIDQINTKSRDELKAEMQHARAHGRTSFEFRHRLANGMVREVLVSSGPITLDGQTLLLSTVTDVTDRKQAEARMREALVVFNASTEAIMTTDAKGRITAVNPAFTRITGYGLNEVIGRSPAMLKSGRHDNGFYAGLWAALDRDGHWEGEIWNRRRNGELYPQWLSISAVRNQGGEIAEYVALFNDITERKQHEDAIWRQANFDALTGLANRNLLADRLERALVQARRSGRKVGLVFLDLDGFKWINDTLGHDSGDALLIEVAERLRTCVREQDTAARLGGDEFTVVIHDLLETADMLPVAEKLVEVLHQPFRLGGGQQQLSGSLGITVFPDDGEDVQTLLKNADIAMYKAKQAGKNRYQFYARHMQVDAQARVQIEADLRLALADHAFELLYQPIVDTDSGELVGAEALIRWQHPERGVISPLDFVPVAEDCGLIVPIGEWVLREAARQWREWRDQGLPALRLSVNVSGVQFRDDKLCRLVADILATYRVDPGCLVLEITESVLMDGSTAAEARLREIKALGVGYSLDDFGTGYSSLSYLKRFPVDIVKIDRSFVNDCPDDRNDAHLVEAIINMAHSLDLRVTAEGVETDEQAEFLHDLGCDYLQGFLIGRPLPARAFAVLIERRQLLLPTDGASLEEGRLLAALRDDELDVEKWLSRLLGEVSPELTRQLAEHGWVTRGLDLRHAIEAHLDWRRRLDAMVGSAQPEAVISIEEAGTAERCPLGRWIRDRSSAHAPCAEELDRAHREFHHLAGRIVAEYHRGQLALARRTLSGVQFRKASRDVVVALINCFRTSATESGTTASDPAATLDTPDR